MEGESRAEKNNSSLLVPGSIIVAGVLIALAVLYVGGGGRAGLSPFGGDKGKSVTGVSQDLAKIADDDPVLGDPAAPVTVVEFADFQCPYCGHFFETAGKQFINDYVKTGKARLVYRDFPFLGDESHYSAQAAECANAQGKFWEYHDYLYTHQNGENQGAFSVAKLKDFASSLGLNTSDFNRCMDDKKDAAEIQKDYDDGRALGVNATPTFFVNGTMVVGAVAYDEFQRQVEAALQAVK